MFETIKEVLNKKKMENIFMDKELERDNLLEDLKILSLIWEEDKISMFFNKIWLSIRCHRNLLKKSKEDILKHKNILKKTYEEKIKDINEEIEELDFLLKNYE